MRRRHRQTPRRSGAVPVVFDHVGLDPAAWFEQVLVNLFEEGEIRPNRAHKHHHADKRHQPPQIGDKCHDQQANDERLIDLECRLINAPCFVSAISASGNRRHDQ